MVAHTNTTCLCTLPRPPCWAFLLPHCAPFATMPLDLVLAADHYRSHECSRSLHRQFYRVVSVPMLALQGFCCLYQLTSALCSSRCSTINQLNPNSCFVTSFHCPQISALHHLTSALSSSSSSSSSNTFNSAGTGLSAAQNLLAGGGDDHVGVLGGGHDSVGAGVMGGNRGPLFGMLGRLMEVCVCVFVLCGWVCVCVFTSVGSVCVCTCSKIGLDCLRVL